MNIIETSSLEEARNIQKDIVTNTRRIDSIDAPKHRKDSDSVLTISNIGFFFLGILYLLTNIFTRETVTRSYYIYSIVFSLIILAMIAVFAIFQTRSKTQHDESKLIIVFISIMVLGFISNISIWIIALFQQPYSNVTLGVIFAHTAFLLGLTHILYYHKRQMRAIDF